MSKVMSIPTQLQFAAALRDTKQPIPQSLVGKDPVGVQRRFAVYRNNVVSGLTRALQTKFPITTKLVGEFFFAAMAGVYIDQHPPKLPILMGYGDNFPLFIEEFRPAMAVPYLADIAGLEAARSAAYHAADQIPLDPATLAKTDAGRLPNLGFVFHPSTSIVRSVHPIVTIWAMNTDEVPLGPIEKWVGEDALIVRPHLMVLVQRLPAGGAAFLNALAAGSALSAAVASALNEAPEFDLATNLAGIIRAGGLAAIRQIS
jgi:hypothetical protein